MIRNVYENRISKKQKTSSDIGQDGRRRKGTAKISERVDGRGCCGDLERLQQRQRVLYILFPFYRFPRREKEIRSTPAITPASDLIISRDTRGGGGRRASSRRYNFNGAALHGVRLLSFDRRKRAREQRIAREIMNFLETGGCARPVHPTGQSGPRVNEYFPMNEIAQPIARFPRNEKNEIALLDRAKRIFSAFSKFFFQNTGNLRLQGPESGLQNALCVIADEQSMEIIIRKLFNFHLI